MNHWEYSMVSLASTEPLEAAESLLNAKGLEGWEAISLTTHTNGGSTVVMKRPLAQRSSGGRM